ncbi:MAG TPA: polyphosphate polymerase domain-containing protein [Bacteroidota bacterium]|nr:polyphosphate polymerase domain-containing protein [Bacteroidota bacterium]
MARCEYKYYLERRHLDNLRKDILPFLTYDRYTQHLKKKEYTVRSIYFDSNDFAIYNEKLDGIRDRNKYRIRGYNQLREDSRVFLEIKRKEVDRVSKDRAPLYYRNLDAFLKTKQYDLLLSPDDATQAAEAKASARNFLYYFFTLHLQPVSLINYEREAFECRFGTGLRITFDKNIRTRIVRSTSDLFVDEPMVNTFEDIIVLEIKFNKIVPAWVPSVMNRYNIIQDSISKYSGSIDISHLHTLNRFLF